MAIATFDKSKSGDINFGIGQPAHDLMPVEFFNEFFSTFLSQAIPEDFNYGAIVGESRFLKALSRFLSESYNASVNPDSLFLTGGSSQAIDFVCSRFTEPGDTILVEDASYFLAFPIFREHHLNIASVQTDENGVIIEELEKAVIKYRPRAIYIVPSYNNPTGVSLSLDRRQQLVSLSREYDFLLISDDAYQLLSYSMDSPLAMGTFIEDGNVISLGTFSKILAPGFRVGWIQCNSTLIENLLESGWINSGGAVSQLSSQLVRSALETGQQDKHLDFLIDKYGSRLEAMHSALHHFLGDLASWNKPSGGYFFWLSLNSDIDTRILREKALEIGSGFQPGALFSPSGDFKNYLRLSFSHYNEAQIWDGVARLASILRG